MRKAISEIVYGYEYIIVYVINSLTIWCLRLDSYYIYIYIHVLQFYKYFYGTGIIRTLNIFASNSAHPVEYICHHSIVSSTSGFTSCRIKVRKKDSDTISEHNIKHSSSTSITLNYH